jgi:hypothetical protein
MLPASNSPFRKRRPSNGQSNPVPATATTTSSSSFALNTKPVLRQPSVDLSTTSNRRTSLVSTATRVSIDGQNWGMVREKTPVPFHDNNNNNNNKLAIPGFHPT